MTQLLIALQDRMPNEFYGPSNVVSSLAKILTDKNFEVNVINFPIKCSENTRDYVLNCIRDIPHTIFTIPRIMRDIKAADIVNFHYLRSIEYILYLHIAKWYRKPVLTHLYFPINQRYIPYILKNTDYFLVMNQYMADYLEERSVPMEKVILLPIPIDTSKFIPLKRRELLEKYQIPENKYVLLYHGRPSSLRGLRIFLESLPPLKENLSDLYVVLSLANVMEDISIEDIQNFITKNHLEFQTKLFIGQNNAAELYNIADIVVFPFLGKGTAICPPLSVLEAMSCGKIVLCSNIDELGVQYIIYDEYNGFLVEPTSDKLVHKIVYIRQLGIGDINQIAIRARSEIVNRNSPEVIKRKYLEVCENL